MVAVTLMLSYLVVLAYGQAPIPNRPLGFVYKNASHAAPVHIDVFLDLACPDSKRCFPVLKQVADMYTDRSVRVKFLIFPLPYHRNAHIAAIVSTCVHFMLSCLCYALFVALKSDYVTPFHLKEFGILSEEQCLYARCLAELEYFVFKMEYSYC